MLIELWGCRIARGLLLRAAAMLSAIAPLAVAAHAQSAAEAASKPPLTIAVLTSSRTDQCFDNGYAAAITKLATQEQEQINRSGGINGRRVALYVLRASLLEG
jgi:hypothetical protein